MSLVTVRKRNGVFRCWSRVANRDARVMQLIQIKFSMLIQGKLSLRLVLYMIYNFLFNYT